MILPNLNEKRVNAELAVFAGSIFIVGGQTSPLKMANTGNEAQNFITNYNNRLSLASVEVLDEKRRKWKKIGKDDSGILPKANYLLAACGAPNVGIFVSGGENNPYEFALIQFDDIDDSQFHAGSFTSQQRNSGKYISLESHKIPHLGHQLHWLNRKLFLLDSRNPPTQVCMYFEIDSKKWVSLPSFTPVPRSFTSSAPLGDVIYMLGSSEEHNSLTQSLQAFDTGTQDWLQMSGLPPSCKDFKLCVIKIATVQSQDPNNY